MSFEPKTFSISIGDNELTDLRNRIGRTRWPDPSPADPWVQGTDLAYLQGMLGYWAITFDWRAQEKWLNTFAHYRAQIDGIKIHYIHERAAYGKGIPLILTHGWPSAFIEMLPIVPLLTNPKKYGLDYPAFDVVIPSLPGYCFSERPHRSDVTTRYTAGLWHRLMRGLRYEGYGAFGTDFGAGVATYMALDDPGRLFGIYLGNLEVSPFTGPGSAPMSNDEIRYAKQEQIWAETEYGYSAIQSTKPQTLSYGLSDSPAGLAAWILEKWHSWSDGQGTPEQRFHRDFLMTLLTLYWTTGTITLTLRDYYDNRWSGGYEAGPEEFVSTPTSIAVFNNQTVSEGDPPREWAERLYNVRRWTEMPRGGHFAAVEEPELLSRDICEFFSSSQI